MRITSTPITHRTDTIRARRSDFPNKEVGDEFWLGSDVSGYVKVKRVTDQYLWLKVI